MDPTYGLEGYLQHKPSMGPLPGMGYGGPSPSAASPYAPQLGGLNASAAQQLAAIGSSLQALGNSLAGTRLACSNGCQVSDTYTSNGSQ